MPSRSTRENTSSRYQGLTCLLCLLLAGSVKAMEPIPYEVTGIDQFSSGRVHGRDVYEGKSRGDRDWEPMSEVRFANDRRQLPPVHVVYPSAPPPVHQVVVRPQPVVALVGEDRVFDRIRLDMAIQRCIFQKICTEEVKAIPGIYLGDAQASDDDWSGEADDVLEVISENDETRDVPAQDAPPIEAGSRAPGRVFVEEPAETP